MRGSVPSASTVNAALTFHEYLRACYGTSNLLHGWVSFSKTSQPIK